MTHYTAADGCTTRYARPLTGGQSRYAPDEVDEMPRDYVLMVCEHPGTDEGEPAIREYFAFCDDADMPCVYVGTDVDQVGGWVRDPISKCSWCDYDESRAHKVTQLDGLLADEVVAACRTYLEGV